MVFPADCRICGAFLTELSRLPVCADCLAAPERFSSPQCDLCGEHLDFTPAPDIEALCPVCREERPHFERAAAFGPYDSALLALVHLLKYQRVRSAARPLGRYISVAAASLAREIGDSAVLVPVPLHRSKSTQRGFNQAEEITRAAAASLCFTHKNWTPAYDWLERVRSTVSQTGLTRSARKENVRGAFRVRDKAAVRGRRIVLIDDVMTTGVTADECARILRRAGAEKVWVVTVARVTRRVWTPEASVIVQ